MLEDRDYMRERPEFSMSLPPLSLWMVILVLNIVVYLVQEAAGPAVKSAFYEYGMLSLGGLERGYVWQLLTFQFLHGGPVHLACNSVALFFCGRIMEPALGKRSFLGLYLLSGVFGGVVEILLGLVSPRFASGVVGASAGICGLIAAFALIHPQSTIYLFFVLPIRAVYFLPVVSALSLGMIIAPLIFPLPNDHIGHAAHLGGILIGVAWIKLNWHRFFAQLPGERFFEGFRLWRKSNPHQRKRELVRAASVRNDPWRTSPAETVAELPQDEFISKEVDPILDKISAHGIQSLTERERKILELAQKKMKTR